MAGQLDERIALVTGGASGIRRAAALAFAQAGATVILANVDVEGGGETRRLLQGSGGKALFLRADVSQVADVEALITQTVAHYGRLECAFNNAGTEGVAAPLADSSEDVWDRVISINLKGVWACMKYELRQICAQGRGTIVNTASIMGLVGSPNVSVHVVATRNTCQPMAMSRNIAAHDNRASLLPRGVGSDPRCGPGLHPRPRGPRDSIGGRRPELGGDGAALDGAGAADLEDLVAPPVERPAPSPGPTAPA